MHYVTYVTGGLRETKTIVCDAMELRAPLLRIDGYGVLEYRPIHGGDRVCVVTYGAVRVEPFVSAF